MKWTNPIKPQIFTLLFCIIGTLNSCSFSKKASDKLLSKASEKSYDVIIVPGVPLENGKWSNIMKARIYWSKFLFDKGIAKNIMFSGSAVYSPYIEAEIMAMYAEALGIPKENIYTETKAEHSTENIFYSHKLAQKLKFVSMAIASDPFQTKMLRKFTRKRIDGDIDLIPIVFDSLKAMPMGVREPEIDIQKAFVQGFIPLPERENLMQRLRGTWGGDLFKDTLK
ncbi:MAG: YdcF family protein [Bacteroidales bacterium]|nr:YdcF family protein [Bacteroidales bacterium]